MPQDPRPVLLTPLWSHFFRLQLYAKMCLFSHKALLITFVKSYRVLERTCWQCFLDLFCKIISDFSRLIICIVDLLVSLFWGLELILDFELCIFALSAIIKEFLLTLQRYIYGRNSYRIKAKSTHSKSEQKLYSSRANRI